MFVQHFVTLTRATLARILSLRVVWLGGETYDARFGIIKDAI
jgi:hypothetical protein